MEKQEIIDRRKNKIAMWEYCICNLYVYLHSKVAEFASRRNYPINHIVSILELPRYR